MVSARLLMGAGSAVGSQPAHSPAMRSFAASASGVGGDFEASLREPKGVSQLVAYEPGMSPGGQSSASGVSGSRSMA